MIRFSVFSVGQIPLHGSPITLTLANFHCCFAILSGQPTATCHRATTEPNTIGTLPSRTLTEIRCHRKPKTENRKPKTENRKLKTENRKLKTENRKPKTENRGIICRRERTASRGRSERAAGDYRLHRSRGGCHRGVLRGRSRHFCRLPAVC